MLCAVFFRLHVIPGKVGDSMNIRRAVMPVVCLLATVGSAFAQHRVDPGAIYARIYAIIPAVGSVTWDDPRRVRLPWLSLRSACLIPLAKRRSKPSS